MNVHRDTGFRLRGGFFVRAADNGRTKSHLQLKTKNAPIIHNDPE